MKPLLLTILICLISLTVFAQELHYSGEGKVTIPLGKEETDATTQASPKIVTELGVVYVGMPKEHLGKAGYTELMQKGYEKQGNEEWITFLSWTTPHTSGVRKR